MSVFPFVRPSVHPSICPSVCLSIRCASHLRNCTSSNYNFWYTCKMMISPKKVYFFLVLIFWAVRGLKEQKIAQNEKNQLDLSRAKSQEQYCIWSWFLVNVFKMMISPGAFFLFFEVFIFRAVRGVKEKKISQNEK